MTERPPKPPGHPSPTACARRAALVVAVSAALHGSLGHAAQECLVRPDAGADLASFVTASGTWRVRESGPGYLWTLDENPGWSSAMACNTDADPISVLVDRWTLAVPPQACRFAQDAPPVALDAARVRAAVDAGRWVAHSAGRADGWPVEFGIADSAAGSLAALGTEDYDPAGTNGTNSGDNLVGVISAQGGEYATSRGAADDPDAEIIARAVAGQDIDGHAEALYGAAFALAGFAHRMPFAGDALRDPQVPDEGPQYEFSMRGSSLVDGIDTHEPEPGWSYDAAHLANTGWALWLATEDPRVGLVVQSHAAFALASQPENLRVADTAADGRMSAYRCEFYQARSAYNCLTAMWRARDVARRVDTDDVLGAMLWTEARVEAMYADTAAQADALIERHQSAPPEAFADRAMRIAEAPLGVAYCATYRRTDGSELVALARSNFQDAQYGGVPAYLRARAGEPLGRRLLGIQARQMTGRMLHLGGAAGLDGRRDLRGSSMPIGPCEFNGQWWLPAAVPFSDMAGWADWVETLDIETAEGTQPPTDSFDGAAGHTAVQTEFILLAARDLVARGALDPVPELDAALARMGEAKARTAEGTMRFPIWFKHAADLVD